MTQTPLGTAAFRNRLVSPRWTSLHPQRRSRVFCSADRFLSRHDFGLGFDKASLEKARKLLWKREQTSRLFMLDCDGDRHADPVYTNYLRIDKFRGCP